MRLATFADTFAQLETTRSRSRMVELVANLLREAGGTEARATTYLLQGQLGPPYSGIETGLGEARLGAALAEAYDVRPSTVTRAIGRSGDLGLVAASLAKGRRGGKLTLNGAFRALLAVAERSGAGSQQGKVTLLAQLLERAGPEEAKLLVRIAQGRLRLGVGDQTILEAAAVAAFQDRRKKVVLEHAYMQHADLGGLVELALLRGEKAVLALKPEIGVPVRPALAQRLPSAAAIVKRFHRVQVEPKYDGFRLQLHRDGAKVWAFSRRLENVSEMFPEVVTALKRQLRSRRVIIEGEAVAADTKTGRFLPFQITMTRKRKREIAEAAARHPLRFFAFDLLYEGRSSWLDRPQWERTARLRELFPSRPGSTIEPTPVLVTSDSKALDAYFHTMLKRGLEGIVAKRPDAPYRAGARGYDWVKLKRSYGSRIRDTVDLVIVGYLRGRGKRAALGIGSLLAAVYQPAEDRFRTVAKVGSGLSDEQWREFKRMLDRRASATRPPRVDSLITPDVWVAPKYVVEVLADEISRSPLHTCGRVDGSPGYALRFPRIVNGIRSDKAPTDATTEGEVLDLFKSQKR